METRQKLQLRAEVIKDEYLKKFESFIERYHRDCTSAKIDYQLVSTATPFEIMLARYLSRRQKYR